MSSTVSGAVARTPRVSIGMPVFNGEKFLARAVESLLSQTFTDFELVISDNASTDSTAAIAAAFAARDPRVRFIRQEKNRGAVFNWNYVVAQARGQYFKWASANDYCAPAMLERCVEALDGDPATVVALGKTAFLDDDDQPLGEYPHDPEILDARPSARFIRLYHELRANNAQSGLIRLDALRRTGIERAFPGGDMGLMFELGLHGKFRRIPEVLLFRRMGIKSATKFRSSGELSTFLDPARKRPDGMVVWRTHWDYFVSVARAPIAWTERFITWRFIARSAWWNRKTLWHEVRGSISPGNAG